MALQKGDLVRGKKPWNANTTVGIVLNYSCRGEHFDTFRVFWLNEKNNPFSDQQTFTTWEVLDSLEKVEVSE